MEGLKAGGAQAIAWIETMSSPDEIRAAPQGAVEAGMPYTFSCSFDTAGKTMMGLHPKDIHGVRRAICADRRSRSAPIAVSARRTCCPRCST